MELLMWLFMRDDCCWGRFCYIIVEFAVYGHQMYHCESALMWKELV